MERKRQAVADLQKKRDERGSMRFCDLPADCYARKAVEEFGLDVTEQTGYWDPLVLEEEWRAWYNLRKEAEAHSAQRTRFQLKMLNNLRKDYVNTMKAAGFAAAKAAAAARGLFLEHVDVVKDGGIEPRTCSLKVRIFSAVGQAKMVQGEHEHHARARSCFFEEHAHLEARLHAVDAESGKFEVVDDLAGTVDSFALFKMDRHHHTGKFTYSLASAVQVQKLVAAIFGQKTPGAFLDVRAAFHVFLMAAGADAHPFTSMEYQEFCPFSYLDMKFRKEK